MSAGADAPARLRARLAAPGSVFAPGAYDGLSAALIRRAGFEVVYASGGAIARSMGYPDLGLVTMTETVGRLEQVVEASGLPVVADADSGYGNALNVERCVRKMASIGVAGLHLEDQTFPKRCGHYEDKSLIPVEEMDQKIRAAREAAGPGGPLVIARTDAIAVEGLPAAIDRAHRYMAAGAEMIFVEAPRSESHLRTIAAELPHPKLLNMFPGGKTPVVPRALVEELGYDLVIVPGDLQRAAIGAMERALAEIAAEGSTAGLEGTIPSFARREELVGTAGYLERDRRYAAEADAAAAGAERTAQSGPGQTTG
jgi:2-methylisocitrate lyase-like PEP mutase family enzyme